MYVLMAATRTWTPRLGLDLKGGTSVTLTASSTNDKSVTPTSLEQARVIIQQRVNSLGVGESSVKTMGDRNIVVSAPNVDSEKLVDMVGQTAQLGFRMVNTYDRAPDAGASPSPSASPSAGPNGTATAPSEAAPSSSASASFGPSASASAKVKQAEPSVTTAQNWQPSEADREAFTKFKCGDPITDEPSKPLITCDREKQLKYMLSPVAFPGTVVTDANQQQLSNGMGYGVNLKFDSKGAKDFADATTYLCSQQDPRNQFAIVLDGKVISAPRLDGSKGGQCPITAGEAQITGNFTMESADDLANVLKYGALPLSFDVSSVDTVSPTLGGEQLNAGLIAGIIGLVLVAAYALIYYRGLGAVTIGSLLVAGLGTYAAMVLLGPAVGFTLSLAGIAGAIVAIGISADSFIVYFERIRDEIRDGGTLRRSLETGWQKARGTILMADGVSLLSAIVLFLLSVDQVKGFAFTLGLTTLMDLFICFFFTHPLIILLGRTKFWGEGRRGSGLEAAHMGVTQDALLGRRRRRTARSRRTAHASATNTSEEA
ncbi:MAG: protein translocase subunit SecD [Cutibacterium granulosum]|nr:protein translocase subunit SecD [Cutibacterium granulosum]